MRALRIRVSVLVDLCARAALSRCGLQMLSSWSLARRAARARVVGVPGLGFRKSFENCQTQRLMHRCGLGPWKIIDQLLVLLYASRGRTRSCPRVLEALSRRVAAAWTDAHSRRQVGELLSKASTLCPSARPPAPARVGLAARPARAGEHLGPRVRQPRPPAPNNQH